MDSFYDSYELFEKFNMEIILINAKIRMSVTMFLQKFLMNLDEIQHIYSTYKYLVSYDILK